jgi:hypothetical protein
MRNLVIALAFVLGGMVTAAAPVWAQTRTTPSQDHFESRRNQAAREAKLRQQQELAKRRPAVPTFTFQQPVPGQYYDYPYVDRPYVGDGQYVLVPGGYQMVYGQLVYVPPHYQFVPRWYR